MSFTGKKVKPYRVEWRAHLNTLFTLEGTYDNHEEARAAAQMMADRFQGQARVLSQHVVMVVGLETTT